MLMKPARILLAGVVLLAMAACATTVVNTGGPRPPQGAGPAGTNFGFWDRDAEGAVDQDFRRFISGRWQGGQEVEARTASPVAMATGPMARRCPFSSASGSIP
jgi:hypothetical protein